jgi:hypothetical protein
MDTETGLATETRRHGEDGKWKMEVGDTNYTDGHGGADDLTAETPRRGEDILTTKQPDTERRGLATETQRHEGADDLTAKAQRRGDQFLI